MKSEMFVSKQIHLDERLVAFICLDVSPFPHGVEHARLSESRMCAAYAW